MGKVIDFHTHAFPEKIVDRAIATLEENSGEKAYHDGRVSSLLASMDAAGIEAAVIANIATKPDQFDAILKWSHEIRSERIIPFLSVHPDDPAAREHIRITKQEGFKGIKLHPYYQEFILDEERLFPIYEEISKQQLVLLSHTGFDIAFPRTRICDPQKIIAISERFPELLFVASHCGAWEDWDEVETLLIGKKIFIEISFSVTSIEPDRAKKILLSHPKEYLLFGTDSPWVDQKTTVEGILSLDLGQDVTGALFYENAARLLLQ
jgi:predicted TIM-barrel fold metal-dependent hydrolase